MTSLKERIAAKERRTALLPIRVGDDATVGADIETLRSALALHLGTPEAERSADHDERAGRLREQLDAALARLRDTVVTVELQALPANEWDAMFGPLEPDEGGDIDLTLIHAPLLAASCTDDDLQDEAWWAEQLADPRWTKGDRALISQTLLQLNVFAPTGVSGKG